jgi:hypothetical protein
MVKSLPSRRYSAGSSTAKPDPVSQLQDGVYIYSITSITLSSEREDIPVASHSASVANSAQAKQSPSARRDLLELIIGYALILATIWTANPTQRLLYWLAFAWIVATSWARRDGWRALGLTATGFLPSLWVVAVAMASAALAALLALRTHTLHRLHGPTPILSHVWGYIIWAVMQQFLLQSYFLLRFLRLLPGKAAPILAAAGIFSLAHLPNPILTPITFIWGVAACVLFLRYRNIYALGLAHGILGIFVAITVPNTLHHHMRVGLGYLRYHPSPRDRLSSYRSHTDHSVSTDACVIAEAATRRS